MVEVPASDEEEEVPAEEQLVPGAAVTPTVEVPVVEKAQVGFRLLF